MYLIFTTQHLKIHPTSAETPITEHRTVPPPTSHYNAQPNSSIMPASDYTGAIGGALKFKGGSKVTKLKKRAKPKPEAEETEEAERASASRRTSDRNDAEPERPELKRNRTSGQSGELGLEKTESPSQERIKSPDPAHKEPEWRTPSKPSLDREDSRGSAHRLSPWGSKSIEGTKDLAEALKSSGWSSKTEAERKHDERRRKRLEEKMKREGVKTHKEKVEEFNKRLANLSEHHDMPRIGPG